MYFKICSLIYFSKLSNIKMYIINIIVVLQSTRHEDNKRNQTASGQLVHLAHNLPTWTYKIVIGLVVNTSWVRKLRYLIINMKIWIKLIFFYYDRLKTIIFNFTLAVNFIQFYSLFTESKPNRNWIWRKCCVVILSCCVWRIKKQHTNASALWSGICVKLLTWFFQCFIFL